ncbi:MAG: regulatory protein RecX [Clostridiaceae bacterium]|nr:regulatory protein RecX [Clostridiaceae bacterium]
MKVTARIKSKNGRMVRIYLDGRYAFSIPTSVYMANHLYEKDELTEEEASHIRQTVLVQSARERAVGILMARDRSRHEVKVRLKKMGFDGDIAEKVVEDLKTIGYIDDSRFVLKYASDRVRSKALSKKALRYELEQKGIDRDLIVDVLKEFEQDEEEIAFRAAKKKFGKYDLCDKSVREKALRFLMHRGFPYEMSSAVIRRLQDRMAD